MKILLISANREKLPCPVTPIGLAYVAAALIDAGFDVRVTDLCFATDVDEAIAEAARSFEPELIGLSIRNVDNLTYPKTTSYLPYLKDVAEKVRGIGVPVVAGGSGFSLFPEEMLKRLGLVYGITGEGEAAFSNFAAKLRDGGDVYDCPNLAYIKDGVFRQNPISTAISFGVPARHLLDNAKYFTLGGMANIQTKRGCPFTCVYCTYPLLDGSRIRCRKAGDVADEMEQVQKTYGIDYFFFVDDIFNHPAKQASEICREIIERGLRISWTCFATPTGLTMDLLQLMKEAGCKGIEFGTDAASEVMLKNMGKSFTKADVRQVSALCKEAGLPAAHYIILGGPGETEETLMEAFDFMDELEPKAIIAMVGVRVYHKTPLERISIAEGIIKEGESILDSTFYVSPLIGAQRLIELIYAHAKIRPNWVVAALNIRSEEEAMTALRKLGHRGPLWDMLGTARPRKRERTDGMA